MVAVAIDYWRFAPLIVSAGLFLGVAPSLAHWYLIPWDALGPGGSIQRYVVSYAARGLRLVLNAYALALVTLAVLADKRRPVTALLHPALLACWSVAIVQFLLSLPDEAFSQLLRPAIRGPGSNADVRMIYGLGQTVIEVAIPTAFGLAPTVAVATRLNPIASILAALRLSRGWRVRVAVACFLSLIGVVVGRVSVSQLFFALGDGEMARLRLVTEIAFQMTNFLAWTLGPLFFAEIFRRVSTSANDAETAGEAFV